MPISPLACETRSLTIMTWLDSLVLGVVEGVTEFLPISSTGHLMITSRLLGLDLASPVLSSFNIAIQLGAILAVVVLYWRALLVDWPTMQRVLVALVPTLLGGALLYRLVKTYFLESVELVLWSLAIGGVVIILFERLHGERAAGSDEVRRLTFVQAFAIGVCQILAMIPGVSRAAATVLGGMALGLRRQTAVEFSFLLAVPTMAAATAKDLYETREHFSLADLQNLAIGFVMAFVIALLTIKLLLRFIRGHTFTAFGIYRIAAALGFALLLR